MGVVLLAALALAAWTPLPRRDSVRTVLVHNLWDRCVPYGDALAWQRALHRERTAAVVQEAPPPQDMLLVMQHAPVLTLGTGSSLAHVRSANPPFELVRTERGGEVTYHGPGQLVVYPLLDLRAYRQDVRWYMGALEEVAIRTCASYGLHARREAGLTGVWVDGAKVCALGVKISRWCTMHGLALNVCPSLSHYEHIVPCGVPGRDVTSLAQLHGRLRESAGDAPSLDGVQACLLAHFSDVFGVTLADGDADAGSGAGLGERLDATCTRDK